jgi:hypothetical protein
VLATLIADDDQQVPGPDSKAEQVLFFFGAAMKINKLVLDAFRGFQRLDVDLAPHLTFIVAMNGAGKTSIIEGLAAGVGALVHGSNEPQPKDELKTLVGEMDHRRVWPPDPALPPEVSEALTIHVGAQWGEVPLSWEVYSHRVLREGAFSNDVRLHWISGKKELRDKLEAALQGGGPLPLLAALRAQRTYRFKKSALPQLSAAESASSERRLRWAAGPWIDVQWNALRDRWFELELRRKLVGERAEAAYQTIVSALMRGLELDAPPVFSGDMADFMIALPGEGWRSVSLMSDGWRAYVGTIVAVALRCAELNPGQSDAAATTSGVLVIDELEQHLHPALQLQIVNGLERAFPGLQIIATTHSSLVLTDITASSADRVLRLDRVGDDAIRVTPLDAPVGRNAVQVLTGAWFGLPSTLDDETLRMMAEHRALLRRDPARRDERKQLEEKLRHRLGRYAETSVEELVLSVVAELEKDPRFDLLSHDQVVALRQEVLARIKAGLP